MLGLLVRAGVHVCTTVGMAVLALIPFKNGKGEWVRY